MDKTSPNALKRARNSKGITQEKAAEMSGYSVDAIQAWEAGTRRASLEALERLAIAYDAPWLPQMYLRELSTGSLAETLPEFRPGVPVSQAVLTVLQKLDQFYTQHSDRRLISLAADGVIDEAERSEYDHIMEDLKDLSRAFEELKYSEKGDGTT